ncbi:MAG: AsnC family transcriptional regulator [Alphaproteobacteria bacterium]|nr:AsnC family transcriptional regulator [Alphaproteobacteria bacterium]
MDQTDQKLLSLLRANAREPLAALARKLGLARSTVQDRLKRLEKERVIAGYSVRLSQEHVQRRIQAHVMISADPKAAAHLVTELKKMPEVYRLAAVSGTYDLMAEVGAESTERIDTILDAIGHLKGVERTMSSIVLSVKFDR